VRVGLAWNRAGPNRPTYVYAAGRAVAYATRAVGIEYTVGAEELHKIGELGAKRVRRWLDGTTRFRIDRSVYDLGVDGEPPMQLRVPQLVDERFERFDLVGQTLDETGKPQRVLLVECKEYSSAGNQGVLYDEYLAVCYSAMVKMSREVGGLPDYEFMWATTHPFAQGEYTNLTTASRIRAGCEAHAERLAGEAFDETIAEQLKDRLWLSIVNPRVEEMIPGREIREAIASRYVTLAGA
jgi:hypothetical protein